MRVRVGIIWVCCALLGRYTPLASGQAKHRLQHDAADGFKIIDFFPLAIAVYDTDQDGDLDCLTAIRAYYDQEHHVAKYVWVLAGVNGHVKENFTITFRDGPSPDQLLINKDDDPTVKIAKFDYTDYKTCTVTEIPIDDMETCILWVIREALADIPQDCEDHYEDNCDIKLAAFDEETCGEILANS